MSSLPPTDSERRRRSLSQDEWIAIIVAFGSIGTILLWAFNQQRQGFDLASLQSLLASPTASPIAAPQPMVSPTDSAKPIAASPGMQASPPAFASPDSSAPAPARSPAIGALPFRPVPAPAVPQVASTVAPQASPNQSPTVTPPPPQFSDVPADFWANRYITALAEKNILTSAPDGTFDPNRPITRAEFAVMLQKAFAQNPERSALKFTDLGSDHWAAKAIQEAVRSRFLSGYPDGMFRPNQQISRLQAQMALVSGLKLQPQASPTQALSRFQDAGEIPRYALPKIAAAVEAGLVLEYPDPQHLKTNRIATRADAAALIYQALQKEGKLAK